MKLILILILLTSCVTGDFLLENQESISNVLALTAPATGGWPIVKWVYLLTMAVVAAKKEK